MHTYTTRTFQLPELEGISKEQIAAHLALYEGYVKHINVLREQIKELEALDKEKYGYAIAEVRRRLGFEFDGMRMHEYYFSQFEGGAQEADSESDLARAVSDKYGSWENFVSHVTTVAMTRGIGWSVVYCDAAGMTLHTAWVADHELGQLSGLPIILALDMWEHAFMVDYLPSEKKKYIESFFKNVNWSVVEERFSKVS